MNGRQLADLASLHKRSVHFAPCQLERRRRQHSARELEELMPSYRKLATFEKFMGELTNWKACPLRHISYSVVIMTSFFEQLEST